VVLIVTVGSLRRETRDKWAKKPTMPFHNGSQQELEIRKARKRMWQFNEMNISALCKPTKRGGRGNKGKDTEFCTRLPKQTNENLLV
jgi:hypothetical protein